MTWYDASFGSSKTGLVTVGVREYDVAGATVVARTIVGVVEVGGGGYGRDFTIAGATVGLEWDTGEATPIFAHEDLVTDNVIARLNQLIEGGRDIDFVGDDVLGWQRIERDIAGAVIRRYNLFDEAGARINETVASFIARRGMISSEVAI